ncbi:hypothetical protein GX441_11910 [bacterium]|nr:hypothetical protein [bacterium]
MNSSPSSKVMECSEVKERLQRKLDGDELPENTKKSIQKHLTACKACSAWFVEIQAMLLEIQSMPEPKPSAIFQARLMNSLGLTQFPLWLRWITGVAVSVVSFWFVLLSLAGEGISSSSSFPILPKLWRFFAGLFSLRSGVMSMFDDMLYLAVIPLGAFALIVLLGIIALRKSQRHGSSEAGSF